MKPHLKISPVAVAYALSLVLLDRSCFSLIPLLAALIHELGHIIVIYLVGAAVGEIEVTIFGAEIRQAGVGLSTLKCISVYGAGAVANLLSAAASALWFHSAASDFFVGCSIALALLNLLPIRSLDGGCIACEVLCQIFPIMGDRIFSAISAITLFLLWTASVFFLLACGGNITLLLFCCYMFLTLYFKEKSPV